MEELPRNTDGWAFFLDLDGTLVDIAPTPEAIVVPRALTEILSGLAIKANGAVAVVSGRTIEAVDRHLAPLHLAAAGVHGAEVRLADGVRVMVASPAGLDSARAAFGALVSAHPALLVEDKGVALSLHYRAAPELEAAVVACAEFAVGAAGGELAMQRGKMVVEVRPAGADKGRAVEVLMAHPPFQGRRPIVLGDDLTDEHMFVVARRLGGLAIRVGDRVRNTAATISLADPTSVRAWLASLR